MSEDDRAAKAARAKALLARKRQQKKAADTTIAATVNSRVVSPVSPARTFSPAPTGTQDDERHDISDVFPQDSGDTSWISSLPRATLPPSSTRISPSVRVETLPPATSIQAQSIPPPEAKDTAMLHRISELESVNKALKADTRRLEDLLSASRNVESLLQNETTRADKLQDRYTQLQHERETALENERQTIALLVSEKASLSAELQQREDFEAKSQAVEELLQAERNKLQELTLRLQSVQREAEEDRQTLNRYQINEKDMSEKTRDLERQLQLASASANESRKEGEEFQRRLHDLTEQVQSDDRVEKLENSLKHTQYRSDELEFQLSKLQQAHISLKLERDELDTSFQSSTRSEGEWKSKISALDTEIDTLKSELNQATTERGILSREEANLRLQLEANQKTITDLQDRFALTSSSEATNARQLQALQTELKNAVRRAEDSEKTTRSLQQEGTNLMRSLDEMRPKIVELTDAKLDMAEKVESLGRALRNRDTIIAKLETSLEDLEDQQVELDGRWKETLSEKEKELSTTQQNTVELQKAYSELQEELDTTLASLKSLESQRVSYHQETLRRLEDIDRLTSSMHAQSEELSNVQHELQARRNAQEEERGFLERAQNEIESLRDEINAKDEEIGRLRRTASSPIGSDAPQSLNGEILGSLRQRQALGDSATQSQVRLLENTTFDGESESHALQKQVNELQDQVARLQLAARPSQRSFSPIPSRPVSRGKDYDLRRSSLGSHRPNLPPRSRSAFDQALSPETLHKRKVSLSMLKARIDSEVAAAATSHPPSRALSPVHSLSGKVDNELSLPSHQSLRRPQLDESHVFWCHTCQGDLVIL